MKLIRILNFGPCLPQSCCERPREDECMAIATDPHVLVDEFAARLETLELSGDNQEEYSTVLCRLQNQAERGEPNGSIIDECLAYLGRFK